MEGKRREFSREVKLEAVRLVTEGGMTIRQVARDLDIRPALLSRWKKKLAPESEEARPEGTLTAEEKQELDRLRRQVKRLEQEREFLKKAAAYFAKESE
jgi:transposase-like protein